MPTYNELHEFHAFSKAPATSNLKLGQSVNKAGHTITSKDVWADKIPYIHKVNDFSKAPGTPEPGDLLLVQNNSGSTYYQYCINNGEYEWAELTQELLAAPIYNNEGKPVLQYHYGKLTPLSGDNNAGSDSNGQAWRFFVGDKAISQFVAPTDIFNPVNGFPATGYAVNIRKFVKGVDKDPVNDGDKCTVSYGSKNAEASCYVDYYSGTVYFDIDARGKNTDYYITFFTYIGDKLDNIINNTIDNKIAAYDNRGAEKYDNDIWGNYVKTSTAKDKLDIHVIHGWTSSTNLPSNWNEKVNIVWYDKAFEADTNNSNTICNIDTNTIKNGDGMFENSALLYFDGKLDNLESGNNMFAGTPLQTYTSNTPNVITAKGMFKGTGLNNFNGDIPALVIGDNMFEGCTKLTSFKANTRNILSAKRMFADSKVKSFSASLPYMYDGTEMFANTPLTNINTAFESLLDGTGMFENTKLSFYAVEKIAKTLPVINNIVGVDADGNDIKQWTNGGSINYNIKKWSDVIDNMYYDVDTLTINPETVGDIMITWINDDYNFMDENQKATVYYEFFELMRLKGWTVITNLLAPDMEEDTRVWVAAYPADETSATHTDNNGNFFKVRTAKVVLEPSITTKSTSLWNQYTSLEDALTNLNLTELQSA